MALTPRSIAGPVVAVLGALFTINGVAGLLDGDGGPSGSVVGLGGSTVLGLAHLTLGLLALLAVVAYDVVALTVRASGEPFGVHWPALVLHACAFLVFAEPPRGRGDTDFAAGAAAMCGGRLRVAAGAGAYLGEGGSSASLFARPI